MKGVKHFRTKDVRTTKNLLSRRAWWQPTAKKRLVTGSNPSCLLISFLRIAIKIDLLFDCLIAFRFESDLLRFVFWFKKLPTSSTVFLSAF